MKYLPFVFLFLWLVDGYAQKSFNDYLQIYPIADDPNIRYMTSYRKDETILFEANPVVRFGIYNNFLKGLMNDAKHTEGWYISWKPQLRMYLETSKPVKMPSYQVLIGTQHLFRLPQGPFEDRKEKFWGFSFESGHYSNGQSGGAFSYEFDDGTAENDHVYTLITPSSNLSEMLNRRNGNFSTNLSELKLNYRIYTLDDDNAPKKMHSFTAGYILYHNRLWGVADIGGYTANDIRIYGRHRYLADYEYMRVLNEQHSRRIAFKQHVEIIQGAHRHVNPVRLESTLTYYPFRSSKALGLLISYIYGHDNYNFRFVDSGHQAAIGLTWNQFPPFAMTNRLD